MEYIQTAKEHSLQKINALRGVLASEDPTFSIVVGGSLARGEASDESDIDYFFFGDDQASVNRATEFLRSKESDIARIVGKAPSADGAFGAGGCETRLALLTDIGGNADENSKITRRILFLLEGAWLTSEPTFTQYRREVLMRYVSEHIAAPHLTRFLLNDVIRYYRTICVDFEFKTVEKQKEWGLRYIKLRYSRQFLYFSGIMAIAQTVGLTPTAKVERLMELFEQTPIERVRTICGSNADSALALYDNFLEKISSPEMRRELNSVTQNSVTHTHAFKELQSKGREFTDELSKILNGTYGSRHPIHRALAF
ncbi:nucleotidyltransferase domain-containing protein [Telluria beijingensis]|uniref:nucleotidyltransferase domain-containing protein n=1 Tax=Telluria beijingensis TaxID=3068633 RepID=UPI0027963944|nr:nucleotidyltransferase domain-containing protein [Massilia sp. REN29]